MKISCSVCGLIYEQVENPLRSDCPRCATWHLPPTPKPEPRDPTRTKP